MEAQSNVERYEALQEHAELVQNGDLDIQYILDGNIDLLFDSSEEKEMYVNNVLLNLQQES